MAVTLLGITVFLHPLINLLLSFSMMALQSLRESYTVLPSCTLMVSKLIQPRKGIPQMPVTLAGIITLVSDEQLTKVMLR